MIPLDSGHTKKNQKQFALKLHQTPCQFCTKKAQVLSVHKAGVTLIFRTNATLFPKSKEKATHLNP